VPCKQTERALTKRARRFISGLKPKTLLTKTNLSFSNQRKKKELQMIKKNKGVTFILTAALGLLIGLLVTDQFAGRATLAQKAGTQSNVMIVPVGGLYFKTPDGRVVAKMAANQDGGNIQIFNAAGQAVAWIGAVSDGGYLTINNNQEKRVAGLWAIPKGGSLGIANSEAKSVAGIYVTQDGGRFIINNNEGKMGVDLTADKVSGNINIYNQDKEIMWSAP